jgi:hypothetical protein
VAQRIDRVRSVEHVLGMLAAGDTPETILKGYLWLEPEDIRACLAYAHKLVALESIEPLVTSDAERSFSSTCVWRRAKKV